MHQHLTRYLLTKDKANIIDPFLSFAQAEQKREVEEIINGEV